MIGQGARKQGEPSPLTQRLPPPLTSLCVRGLGTAHFPHVFIHAQMVDWRGLTDVILRRWSPPVPTDESQLRAFTLASEVAISKLFILSSFFRPRHGAVARVQAILVHLFPPPCKVWSPRRQAEPASRWD